MHMNGQARDGYSLIEIIIVITIIGILAAVAIPGMTRWIKKGKITGTQATLKVVDTEVHEYHNDTNIYPSTLNDLRVRPLEEKVSKRWQGPYSTKEPVDSFGNELVYRLNPKGTQPPYELYSWGQNGEGSPQEEWIRPENA
jgi:general secretion pathway protein G